MIEKKVLLECPRNIELPFNYSPLVSMYHGCAFPIGIIMACAAEHEKDITPWLCGKYINWMYVPGLFNKYNHYFDDSWMRNDGILRLQRIRLRRETYHIIFEDCDIVDLFRLMLSQGFYPSDYYNEKRIPGKAAYNRYDFKHDFVLTGYDDNQETFISGGYLSDGHFHKFTIPYHIFREAYNEYTTEFVTCNFWKYNDKADYSLRLGDVVRFLEDYLYSKTSVNICTRGRLFGMEAMKQLPVTFKENASQGKPIDPRFTLGFMEHKKMMATRIQYLTQIGVLNDSGLYMMAHENSVKSETVHTLGIKYSMTRKPVIIDSIQHTIMYILENEQSYLPKVLKALKLEIRLQ